MSEMLPSPLLPFFARRERHHLFLPFMFGRPREKEEGGERDREYRMERGKRRHKWCYCSIPGRLAGRTDGRFPSHTLSPFPFSLAEETIFLPLYFREKRREEMGVGGGKGGGRESNSSLFSHDLDLPGSMTAPASAEGKSNPHTLTQKEQ